MSAPQEDLIRGITPIRAKDNGRTMVGYPVVFDQWTEIHSWEGDFVERIGSTALNETLKQRGDRVKVQYNHGMHPVVGTSGLGKARTMSVEDAGLYTEVPLSETSYNRDIIIPQLSDGTLDGMSFRFSVVREEWVDPKRSADHNPDKLPERTITELRLYEFGPVDAPAYEATQVGIRSAAGLGKWLQAPPEERAEFTARFGITADYHRLIVPGFSPARDAGTDEAADPRTSSTDAADTGTSAVVDVNKRRRRDEKWKQVLARANRELGRDDA